MTGSNTTIEEGGRPLVDSKGLTEEEFLAAYKEKDYPKPSLTADICVFRRSASDLELLLIRRGGHPYLGCWALPGGFVKKGESADTAAARELAEETGASGLALTQVGFYSTPGRDPRGWIVSSAYLSLDESGCTVQAGDDAADATWFRLIGWCAGDDASGLQEGRPKDVDLVHGDTRLSLSFTPHKSTVTGRYHADEVVSHGLAFDHADIIADALMALLG